MVDNQIFRNYFYEKNYSKCILLIKNKIVNYLVNQIKEIDSTFNFTTVTDLVNASDFYLGNSIIARQLEIALIQENALEQLNLLLSICETHEIK